MKTLILILWLIAAQLFADSSVKITNTLSEAIPTAVQALPKGAAPKNASSGNVANAAAVATLAAGSSGRTNYLSGFQITASGSTAALVVNATVTGLVGGTQTYTFAFPAGVLVAATPLVVNFARPVAASGSNTAIAVTLPAGGTGNTNAAVNVQGYEQ